jgi:putative protease
VNHILEIRREDAAPTANSIGPHVASRPEILAPAGNREMMRAAIENGADAVYFGLQEFNARIRAANFSVAELPEIMAWLHTRGVRGYVTLNTLVFSSELTDIARVVKACSDAGVDAVLAQDLGLARLCTQMAPELPVHASTQMTLTCAESILGAEALGLKLERVVAARETSIKELRTLRRGTTKEIEVFVHGAICVAYSGQCLTSEALGGRSANRGECAQACRLPYDLFVDDVKNDLEDVRYLLSPKDLSAYNDIGELIRAGIVSLKIEGRLKSPLYVAATVQAYRKAVDEAFGAAGQIMDPRLDGETTEMLEMTFSRGFTGGYLHETNHQAVVEGRFPKKRGLYLGEVMQVQRDAVLIALVSALKPGDGVVFDAGHPEGDEQGGRVYEIEPHGKKTAWVRFGRGAVDFGRITVGDRVWKTSDPALDRKLGESFAGEAPRYRRPVSAHVVVAPGRALRLTLTHSQGESVTVEDIAPADVARSRPLTVAFLQEQIGRLGGTPFYLAELTAEIFGEVMVPMSRLNALRRQAVDELLGALASRATSRTSAPAEVVSTLLTGESRDGRLNIAPANSSRLSVLCRTLEQVEVAAQHAGVVVIYTDFEDIRLHREARLVVPKGRGPQLVPASLRVIKPGEAPFARKLLEADPDAILVRNLAAWEILREITDVPLLADYSLNVANHLTARLLKRNGFASLTPSYDLNIDQLCDMLAQSDPSWFEVTIHQHLPMFHMEHCVFCRFLSEGTDFTNCGRPCESHEIELRDRMGYKHPVKADAGCRNTVFNAIPQSAGAYLDRLLGAGVRRYRIELLKQNAAETRQAIDAYLPAIRGESNSREIWRQVKAISKLGVTRGSLDT